MSERNGSSPDTLAQLKEQRRRNALLQEQIRTHQLERVAQRYTPLRDQEKERLKRRLQEDVGWSYVGAYDEAFDRFSGPDRDLLQPISLYQDRRYGANWPFWRTWLEHARIRAGGRLIVGQGLFSHGALEGLCNYVIATGYTDQALAKSDETPDALVAAVQECLDEFARHNEWQLQQRELFMMSRRDGECFWRFVETDDGMLEIDQILPEQVMEPIGCTPETDQFGVLTEPGHLLQVNGYWLALDGDAGSGFEVSAEEMVHVKINVDRCVKRGMSDFSFDTYDTLRGAQRLIDALSTGSAIQASIALIRQHEQAVATEVQGFVQANSDFGTPYPSAGTTPGMGTSRRYLPGTIEDIPKGMSYQQPPFGTNAQNFVAVEQAVLRAVAVRWNAPEWLISGDASNNNYASSITAESPFVRACEAKQKLYGTAFQRTAERAVQARCDAGRLRCLGRTWPWDEVRRLVEIKSEPPSLVVRNKLQEAQTDQILMQGKVKSPQTVCQEQGLDYEQEQRNIADHEERTGGQGDQLPMPGEQAPAPGGGGGGNPLAALLGEGWQDLPREDLVDLLEARPKHAEGDRWQTNGRWYTVKQGRTVRAKATADEHAAAVDAAHERLRPHLAQGKLTPEQLHEHLGHLLKLTGAQLTTLKQRLGLKASGPKFELAAKLVQRATQKVREPKPGAGGPPAKQAPAPTGSPEENTYDAIARAFSREGGTGGAGSVRADHVVRDLLASGMKKPDIEAALVKLVDDGAIAVNAHNHTGFLSRDEDALIPRLEGTPIATIHVRDSDSAAVERMRKAISRVGKDGPKPSALARKEPAAAEPKPSEQAPAGNAAHHAAVAQAIQQSGGDLTHLADIAQRTGLGRAEVHSAVNDLRRQGLLSATGAEGRHGLTARDKEHGIRQGDDLLTHVAPREGSEQALADLAKSHKPAALEPAPAPRRGGKKETPAPKGRGPKAIEPMAGHPLAGLSRQEMERKIGADSQPTTPPNPWNLPVEDKRGIVPDVVSAVKTALEKNSFVTPTIADLYDAARAKHPDLSLREFQGALLAGSKSGHLRLMPYTGAPSRASDEDLAHMFAIGQGTRTNYVLPGREAGG